MEMIFRTQTFSTALGLGSEDTPSPRTPLLSYLLQSHSQRLRQTCTNTRMHQPVAGPAAPAVHPPASASAFTLLPGLGPLFLGNFKGSTDLEGVGMGWWISALVVRPRFFPVLRRLCPCCCPKTVFVLLCMLGFSEFTSEAGKGLFGITTEIKREKANVIKSGENQDKSSLHLYTVSHGKTWSTPRPLGGGLLSMPE